MFAPLLSFDRRAVRLSTIVFAGAMALTACDTDEPIAPNRPDVPEAAQPALLPGFTGTLVIKVVDKNQALITMSLTEFKVVGPTKCCFLKTQRTLLRFLPKPRGKEHR